MKKNVEFFDELSSYYDEMIRFDDALKRRKEILKKHISIEMKNAADIGCGSGLDSISLSKNGLEVTGFDSSIQMIELAKQNAKRFDAKINFINCPAEKISSSYFNYFDLVVSLGNALANLPVHLLGKAVKKSFQMLKPSGEVLFQILNYEYLLLKKERIVNITENNHSVFIRFYDYYSGYLNFNFLTYQKDNLKKRKLITTKLYGHKFSVFEELLKESGFTSIKLYGSLNGSDFIPTESKDLIIKASKK